MKAVTPFLLLALVLVGCDEDTLVAPETAGYAAVVATSAPMATADAASSDLRLQPPEDYVLHEDDNQITIAFFNPEEGILSVHSTNDVFSCGTPLNIMPLADRLVATPAEVTHLNSRGTLFTRVYSSLPPTGLDDFLADACLFLDTTTPTATGIARFHYTRVDGTPHDGLGPYTLTVAGTLLDTDDNQVHLTLNRVWGWTTAWEGPTLRVAGDGGV